MVNVKKLHYLAVKTLPRLLRGISSKQIGDYYCLGCFHSYSTAEKLKKNERLCNNHKFCETEMPTEKKKNIKIFTTVKIIKDSSCIYCDIESSIKEIDT